MPELYEPERFISNRVPVRVLTHSYDGADIFTPLHWHRNVEFNVTTAGRIIHNIDGKNKIYGPGEWNVIASGELHSNQFADRGDHFEGITVQIGKPFLDKWLGEKARLIKPEEEKLSEEIRNLLLLFPQHSSGTREDDLMLMELLFRLLSLLAGQCVIYQEDAGHKDKDISHIKNILTYLDEHYAETLDLKTVAEEYHYSSAYLSRMFKEHIGQNFHGYLQNTRLMHCIEQMKANPDIRLLDCAENNGFSNVKSFIQTFKKNFGCTPSEWLKNHRRQ